MNFEERYFRKISFSKDQLEVFYRAAKKDFKIASAYNVAEIRFKFSYDGLVKLGIALIAMQGYKVRSVSGHHIKIIEALSTVLKEREINAIGDVMRQTRNNDLYQGGFGITEKESMEYFEFVKNVFKRAKEFYEKNLN